MVGGAEFWLTKSSDGEMTNFPNDQQFEDGLAILDAIYANGNPAQTEMLHDFREQGYTMADFIQAIDSNRLPGIDLDDVGYNFAIYGNVVRFIRTNAPSHEGYLDPSLLNLPEDFNPYNPHYTQQAKGLIDQIHHKLVIEERISEIPAGGGFDDIFSDPSRIDLVKTISSPLIDGDTATIRITWINGSTSKLLFKEYGSGSANVPTSGTELPNQIADFYKFAAESQPYNEVEMGAQYDEIRQALDTHKSSMQAKPFVDTALVGGVGLFLYAGSATAAESGSFFSARTLSAAINEVPKWVLPVTAGLIVFDFALSFHNADHPTELQMLQEEGLNYFKKFNSAQEFTNALNADSEMKQAMRLAYWLSHHQES